MRLIDSHAHLDDRAFDNDRAALIARLHADSVGVITVGASLESSRAAIRLAERHRGLWATVGAHPHGARFVNEETLAEFERLAARPCVVAIGEIGLDYYRDLSPRDVQRSVFAKQLELARRLELAIVLHNRESTEDLLATLHKADDRHRGVVHSFLGDSVLAETFLDLGLDLGIGGPLTFPKNGALRDAVKKVPLDRILLETDCPYLTPVPYRGRRNEPAYVRCVAEAIAELKGIPVEDVEQQTTVNASRLFGLPDAP